MKTLEDSDKAGLGLAAILLLLMFIASILNLSAAGFPLEAFSSYRRTPEIEAKGLILNFIFYYLVGYRAMDWIKENE